MTESVADQSSYLLLPLEQIQLDKNNPRKINAEDPNFIQQLESFAETIKGIGVIEPIVVKRIGDDMYELLSGERRYRACKLLNLATIPSVIRSYDENDEVFVKVVENVARESLSDMEVWNAVQTIQERFPDMSKAEIARRLGKTATYINRIEILASNAEYQELVTEELLAPSMVFIVEAFKRKIDGEEKWSRLVEIAKQTKSPITASKLKQDDSVDDGEISKPILQQLNHVKRDETSNAVSSNLEAVSSNGIYPVTISREKQHHATGADQKQTGVMKLLDSIGEPDESAQDIMGEIGYKQKAKDAPKKTKSETDDKEPVYRFRIRAVRFRALLRKFGIEADIKTDEELRKELQMYLDNF
jgi:ParB/RepB/Spo0J family partition protein